MQAVFSVSPNYALATASSNLIYKDSRDMAFFKNLTVGGVIVAGSRTAKTLTNGLPSRECLSIGKTLVPNWEQTDITNIPKTAYVIGGAYTINSLLNRIDMFWVSHFFAQASNERCFLSEDVISVLHHSDKRTVLECESFRIIQYQRSIQLFKD